MSLSPIIISPDEAAEVFAVHIRTIHRLAEAGLIVRLRRGEIDLIASVQKYCKHLREVAGNSAPTNAKEQAMIELGLLRKAQRDALEKKNGEFIKVVDAVAETRVYAGNVRGKMLDAPARIRRRIEEKFPGLLGPHSQTTRVEEAIQDVIYAVMEEIAAMTDRAGEQMIEYERARAAGRSPREAADDAVRNTRRPEATEASP